jgi:hypothetical protein
MVFVVEDGSGLQNSNSYSSVLDADEYLVVTRDAVAWLALSQSEKESFLIFATRFLDQNVSYKGSKASTTQALRWPRYYAEDCDGQIYLETELPRPIRNATIELAAYFAVNTTINPAAPVSSSGGLSKLKVDVVTLVWKDETESSAVANSYPTHISTTLECLGILKYGAGRGSRFKDIYTP